MYCFFWLNVLCATFATVLICGIVFSGNFRLRKTQLYQETYVIFLLCRSTVKEQKDPNNISGLLKLHLRENSLLSADVMNKVRELLESKDLVSWLFKLCYGFGTVCYNFIYAFKFECAYKEVFCKY